MKEIETEKLSGPDLTIGGFELWVHGYANPEIDNAWDGNWLSVTARCTANRSIVSATGALLETVGILRFADELRSVCNTLQGDAILGSYEPNIRVRVSIMPRTGQGSIRVELTPDHMTQSHRVDFDCDQTFLAPVIDECGTILERYPVRSPAERGV
jgi:hypothetical protein